MEVPPLQAGRSDSASHSHALIRPTASELRTRVFPPRAAPGQAETESGRASAREEWRGGVCAGRHPGRAQGPGQGRGARSARKKRERGEAGRLARPPHLGRPRGRARQGASSPRAPSSPSPWRRRLRRGRSPGSRRPRSWREAEARPGVSSRGFGRRHGCASQLPERAHPTNATFASVWTAMADTGRLYSVLSFMAGLPAAVAATARDRLNSGSSMQLIGPSEAGKQK